MKDLCSALSFEKVGRALGDEEVNGWETTKLRASSLSHLYIYLFYCIKWLLSVRLGMKSNKHEFSINKSLIKTKVQFFFLKIYYNVIIDENDTFFLRWKWYLMCCQLQLYFFFGVCVCVFDACVCGWIMAKLFC